MILGGTHAKMSLAQQVLDNDRRNLAVQQHVVYSGQLLRSCSMCAYALRAFNSISKTTKFAVGGVMSMTYKDWAFPQWLYSNQTLLDAFARELQVSARILKKVSETTSRRPFESLERMPAQAVNTSLNLTSSRCLLACGYRTCCRHAGHAYLRPNNCHVDYRVGDIGSVSTQRNCFDLLERGDGHSRV